MWVFDSTRKRITLYSLIAYYPILSLLVGAPIPFPSLMDITPDQIAIFNFASLLITIMGSIVGVGFYLERRSNTKSETQNKKIDDVDEHIDESVIAVRMEIKELRNEMKEMEKRICESMVVKNNNLENNMELKVQAAKELVDTKFKHIDETTRELRSALDNIQRYRYMGDNKNG